MTFVEKWLAAVDESGSVLCAGMDFADFEMGRGEKGLGKGDSKADVAEQFMHATAPHVAAWKPNTQYWKTPADDVTIHMGLARAADYGDALMLKRIGQIAAHYNKPVIHDSKLADIGDTNDAGIYAVQLSGAHAVTIAPYAGNMKETNDFAAKRDISTITMCLMSNPEYQREKNNWVNVSYLPPMHNLDVIRIEGVSHARRYAALAHEAQIHGLAGIVIGAPTDKNHIKPNEIALAARYFRGLVLVPGVGFQGGTPENVLPIFRLFGPNNVIVNVGRDLMLPKNGSYAETGKYFARTLDDVRRAA